MLHVLMPTMLERLGTDCRLIDLGCSWAQESAALAHRGTCLQQFQLSVINLGQPGMKLRLQLSSMVQIHACKQYQDDKVGPCIMRSMLILIRQATSAILYSAEWALYPLLALRQQQPYYFSLRGMLHSIATLLNMPSPTCEHCSSDACTVIVCGLIHCHDLLVFILATSTFLSGSAQRLKRSRRWHP